MFGRHACLSFSGNIKDFKAAVLCTLIWGGGKLNAMGPTSE